MNSGEQDESDDHDGAFRRAIQAVMPAAIRRHYSLKFLVAFLVVVVGVAFVGGLNFVLIQDTVEAEAADELRSQATSRALQQSQWVSEMRSQTQLVSGTVQSFSLSLRDARGRSSSDVVAIHYVNVSQREVTASTDRQFSGQDLEHIDAPWVQRLDDTTLLRAPVSEVWTTNVSYEREDERVVAFASPTPDGHSAVVLVASNQRIIEQFESTGVRTTGIYTATGRHLFGDRNNVSGLDARVLDQVDSTDRSQLVKRDDDLVVYAPVNQTGWVAVTRASKSDLYQASNAVGRNVMSIIATSVLLLVVIGTILGRHTVVPLDRLRQRTQELAANDFDVDLTTDRVDEIGQLYDDFGVMRDALEQQIRETREAKEEIEAQRDNLQRLTTRFQLALEETNTGVWEWDLETDDVTWDESSERLFGYEPGGFPGTFDGFAARVPDEDLAAVQRELDTAIQTGDEFSVDFRVLPPDHDRRWIQARGVVKNGENGEPRRLLGIQTDITERKERERELEETKRRLERSNEKLERFAGVVSHDLRNPLNVILGRIKILADDDERVSREHVEPIERSAVRMQDIIEDLLVLSRVGQDRDDRQAVSLAAVAADSWENVRPDGTDFDLRVPDTTTISADRDRMMHVFENLFRNAREHNDPPLTIRVGLIEAPSDGDGEVAGFFVEDDGDGVPESDRDEIFDHGYTTNADGTGFGLSIVEEIVTAHDWTVSVCEGDDGGARFEIRTNGRDNA